MKKVIVQRTNGVARIMLNRPKVLNCLDEGTLIELGKAIKDIGDDNTIGAAIISGKGRAFCSGADLRTIRKITKTTGSAYQFGKLVLETFGTIENLVKPVIAAVHGFALAGGFELMLACDMVVSTEDAKIGDHHIIYSLLPGGGSSQRLPRIVGVRRAKELLFTGRWISGREAESIGLVNKVVPQAELDRYTLNLAQDIASKSSDAIKAMKLLVNEGIHLSLKTALDLELQTFASYMATSNDVIKGLRAFESRKIRDNE